MLSRETGGAAGIHIILCGENKPLMNILKEKRLNRQNLEIKCQGTLIQMAYAIFKGHINTQKI